MKRSASFAPLFPLLLLAACSRTPPEPTPSSAPESASPGAPHPALPAPPAAGTASVVWSDPAGWVKRPPANPMRRGEYAVPKASGDSEDAECVIHTFGPGQGGSVEANLDRWVRQFDGANGAGDKKTREVAGLKVTTIDVAGTYKAMAMPGSPVAGPKEHSRMPKSSMEPRLLQ